MPSVRTDTYIAALERCNIFAQLCTAPAGKASDHCDAYQKPLQVFCAIVGAIVLMVCMLIPIPWLEGNPYVIVAAQIKQENPGAQKLLYGAFGLPFGLALIVICGGELFTANAAMLPAAIYEV